MATDLYLVTSGNIGEEVAAQLARQGHRVRLLVRQQKPIPTLDALGVEQVAVDLGQPATLAPAFVGVHSYFSVTPFVENLVELGTNAVQAAQQAGVQHFVRSSARGASPAAPIVMGQWHGAVEQRVKESGLNYTILQPASFFQNYLGSAGTIAGQNVFYGSSGDGPAALIDARDIAAAAVAALTGGAAHYGKTYDLTGAEALSNHDVAAVFTEVLGRRVDYANLSEEQMLQALTGAAHLPPWMADAFVELDRITRQGYVANPAPDLMQLIGRPARTFRQFVQENRAAFTTAVLA